MLLLYLFVFRCTFRFWPRKVAATGMASKLKPRLEALAVFLSQCEKQSGFEDLRKFDLFRNTLEEQLASLDLSEGAGHNFERS
jgi:hypothetical protein